jgi:hypothetical protein
LWEVKMAIAAPRWTKEDIEKLKDLAGKYPRETIATHLGRGASSIAVKAHQLRISLRLKRRLKPPTAAEIIQPDKPL